MTFKPALFCGLLLAGANAMACYTVYDANQRVLYQGLDAPVDMSLPLREGLRAAHYPAQASLVFNQGARCTPVRLAQVPRPATSAVPVNTIRMEGTGRQVSPPTSTAPLLTDRHTAERQGLPHTVVAGDIVLVPPRAVARLDLPTFTVVPAETALASAPDTRTLGAGPAPRQHTVITELRDPPMTIIQRGANVDVLRD